MKIDILLLIVLLTLVFPASANQKNNYADRPEVRQFVTDFADAHEGFTVEQLLILFDQAEYKQPVIDAISRPAEKTLEWRQYQDIFLTRRRVSEGERFMARHSEALIAAYERYGVPPAIITSVIGVETMYGGNRGSFRVIDALTTLAFDYPPRAQFFKQELGELLLLAREENRQVTDLLGSYAGAMGYGQFIPSSYRRFAVDFDSDGFRDIWDNPVDAIGSVANYLHEHGWQTGKMIVLPVEFETSKGEELFSESLKPSFTMGELRKRGVRSKVYLGPDEKVLPIRLRGKRGDEYWLGLNNFYVITRYNHSKLYAMAVYQLSQRFRRNELAILLKP